MRSSAVREKTFATIVNARSKDSKLELINGAETNRITNFWVIQTKTYIWMVGGVDSVNKRYLFLR